MSGPQTKSTQILLTKGRGTLTEEPGDSGAEVPPDSQRQKQEKEPKSFYKSGFYTT